MKIAETIDSIGGETNAFTGKEYTGYYAKVDKNHFETALDFVRLKTLTSLAFKDFMLPAMASMVVPAPMKMTD